MTLLAVTLTQLTDGIFLIRMQDQEHKNTFSPALLSGLMTCFAGVREHPDARVVILTGYDNYFSTGGTKESLLALQHTQGNFTDANVYSLALECPLPVISAMQGHAIGGGLVMGLFSDLIIMSQESIYAANFMKYGFTPGMGATLILPLRLGDYLALEMLYTSRNYRGEELARRGAAFEVLPRDKVLTRAVEVAQMLAEKPRHTLTLFKAHMTRQLRTGLDEIIKKELEMHAKTMHHPDVLERIERLFGN